MKVVTGFSSTKSIFLFSGKTGNDKSPGVKNDGLLMVSKIFVKQAIKKFVTENGNKTSEEGFFINIFFRKDSKKRIIL